MQIICRIEEKFEIEITAFLEHGAVGMDLCAAAFIKLRPSIIPIIPVNILN